MSKFYVVVAYDCRLGSRGDVVSRHKSRKAAERACRRSGHDSFLAVREVYGAR